MNQDGFLFQIILRNTFACIKVIKDKISLAVGFATSTSCEAKILPNSTIRVCIISMSLYLCQNPKISPLYLPAFFCSNSCLYQVDLRMVIYVVFNFFFLVFHKEKMLVWDLCLDFFPVGKPTFWCLNLTKSHWQFTRKLEMHKGCFNFETHMIAYVFI